MKNLVRVMTIVAVVYVLLGVMSCTSYTCPTYSKAEVTQSKNI